MEVPTPTRIAIYHNILWSKYKGGVFSQLDLLGRSEGVDISFTQIAETETQRVSLSSVDHTYHRYPYRLLFKGSYENVPWWRRVFALARDLLRHPSDLVVLPGYHRSEFWAMLMFCMVLRRRRAVFSDSTEYDKPEVHWREVAKRIFLSHCHGYFTYGVRSKQYLLSYGVSEDKIHIRRQAAALPHDYDAAEVLRRYSLLPAHAFDAPRFVFIGRLSVEKGLFDLLEAFRSVRSALPAAQLVLIGAGPLQAELEARVTQLDMSDTVVFAGSKELEDIVPLFAESVALVLPSHSEPWGLVVNEALSYGCPVVVSNECGCVPELVSNGTTGYSFAAGDVAGLSAAMIASAALSKDRLSTATQCLRAVSAFTPQTAARQILDGCLAMVGADT